MHVGSPPPGGGGGGGPGPTAKILAMKVPHVIAVQWVNCDLKLHAAA